jgi:ActR/RegA family two-component response regulator
VPALVDRSARKKGRGTEGIVAPQFLDEFGVPGRGAETPTGREEWGSRRQATLRAPVRFVRQNPVIDSLNPCYGRGVAQDSIAMPGHVVLVHDKPSLIEQVAPALTRAGYEVSTFNDPMPALSELETGRPAEVLITRLQFGPDRPTGLALALMTRSKQPDIKVLFVGLPQLAHHAEGVGEFLAIPFSAVDLVDAVKRLRREAHASGTFA